MRPLTVETVKTNEKSIDSNIKSLNFNKKVMSYNRKSLGLLTSAWWTWKPWKTIEIARQDGAWLGTTHFCRARVRGRLRISQTSCLIRKPIASFANQRFSCLIRKPLFGRCHVIFLRKSIQKFISRPLKKQKFLMRKNFLKNLVLIFKFLKCQGDNGFIMPELRQTHSSID